jgi:Core-2/I-Branching enzyme
MPSIGFVLLTHGNEPQILRLTDTLNQMFGDPPIACHHDFSKLALNKRQFPGNVHFVEPHVRTSWGTISLVHAMLKALRLLYDTSAPDWFYLLSGSDYPIRDAASIRNELAHSPFDAYIRLNKIDHTRVPKHVAEDTGGLDSASYQRLAYARYIGRSIPVPSPKHPFRGPAAMHFHILNPRLLRPFHPFDAKFYCYAGDQWFAANAKSAAALLAPGNERLLNYFTGRFPPDEAFCPTVLGNAPGLKVSNESKHHIRWEAGNHPRLLNEKDLPDLLTSKAHFARKFAANASVLNALDTYLGMTPAGAATRR